MVMLQIYPTTEIVTVQSFEKGVISIINKCILCCPFMTVKQEGKIIKCLCVLKSPGKRWLRVFRVPLCCDLHKLNKCLGCKIFKKLTRL